MTTTVNIPTLAEKLQVLRPTLIDDARLAADVWDVLIGQQTYSGKVNARVAIEAVLALHPTGGVIDFTTFIVFQVNRHMRLQLTMQAGHSGEHIVPMVERDRYHLGDAHSDRANSDLSFTPNQGGKAKSMMVLKDDMLWWKIFEIQDSKGNTHPNEVEVMAACYLPAEDGMSAISTVDKDHAVRYSMFILKVIEKLRTYVQKQEILDVLDSVAKQVNENMYSSI